MKLRKLSELNNLEHFCHFAVVFKVFFCNCSVCSKTIFSSLFFSIVKLSRVFLWEIEYVFFFIHFHLLIVTELINLIFYVENFGREFSQSTFPFVRREIRRVRKSWREWEIMFENGKLFRCNFEQFFQVSSWLTTFTYSSLFYLIVAFRNEKRGKRETRGKLRTLTAWGNPSRQAAWAGGKGEDNFSPYLSFNWNIFSTFPTRKWKTFHAAVLFLSVSCVCSFQLETLLWEFYHDSVRIRFHIWEKCRAFVSSLFCFNFRLLY